MRFFYISPSVLPSRSANSVHVMLQCAALKKYVSELRLFAKRVIKDQSAFGAALTAAYGVPMDGDDVVSCYSKSTRGDNLKIAFMALVHYFFHAKPDVVLSRNLYASYVLGVLLRKPLLFETHQLETGFRKRMQKMIMASQNVVTIAISQCLVEFLTRYHDISPRNVVVLHDAAPAGIQPLPFAEKRISLVEYMPSIANGWDAVCGYFGHLYPGRGIEIIESMAQQRPTVLFLVFGGNESDVLERRAMNAARNIVFVGHVPFPVAQKAMKSVNVLLMPYQATVSIGVSGHDTAKWMSPMKMFEYMATGVPLISSDLPVLREVLRDGENALLVDPASDKEWLAALDRILREPDFAAGLGAKAHSDYVAKHTWDQRAIQLIEAAKVVA